MNTQFADPLHILGAPKMKDDYFSSTSRRLGVWLAQAVDGVLDRLEHGREHAMLARMDGRELQDIGMARSDIDRVMTVPKPRRKPL